MPHDPDVVAGAMHVEYVVVDQDTGRWCPTCALPSGVWCRWALCGAFSLRVLGHHEAVVCTSCGEHWPAHLDGPG